MQKTIFEISKMDCPSEENLIKLKLEEIKEIDNLEFDIPGRKLTVYHEGNTDNIESSISELKLGEKRLSSESVTEYASSENIDQKTVLWTVLIINFSFFLIEIISGLISGSMGLVADSLDMMADAFVYGISLLAVGGSVARKKNVAKIAGYFQLILAIIGFGEVIRRFLFQQDLPVFTTMIYVSVLALIANGICLYVLQRSKSKEAHIQASMIFTSNDVIINLGVIIAAVLVHFLNSNIPDLLVGTLVFIVVIRGALKILKLSK